jgi:hypothetical protein
MLSLYPIEKFARSTAPRVAACLTISVCCFASEARAQRAPEQPSRSAVRLELQRIEAGLRRCGAARANFLARISIDSSGRGASVQLFAPSEHSQVHDADMGFDRRPPAGQKAGARLTSASRACVLRGMQSFRVLPFSRPRFVVSALMEIAHGAATPW